MVTAIILGLGISTIGKGKPYLSQNLMRARIVSQGITICNLLFYFFKKKIYINICLVLVGYSLRNIATSKAEKEEKLDKRL